MGSNLSKIAEHLGARAGASRDDNLAIASGLPSGLDVGQETNEGDGPENATLSPAVIQKIKSNTGDVNLHRPNLTNVEGNQYTTVNNIYTMSHLPVHPMEMLKPHDVDKLKGWLSIINQRAIQKDNHNKKTPGTVEWILVDSKLTTWLAADEGILWGTGMPGAGKTVLAASVVDHLLKMQQEDPSICVAVAYCRYTDPWTAEEIVGSLIRQQVESHPHAIIPIVKPIYDRLHVHDVRPSQEDLMTILRSISSLKVFRRTFYTIDGLDEASSDLQVEILDSLASLPVHFLITSRRLDILKQLVPHARFFDIVVRDHDIGILIEKKLRQTPNLRGVLKDETLKSIVISRIIEKSSGMFLLASLQLDMLAVAVSVRDLRERLERLPDGVTEMYAATMKRTEKAETSELAKRALTWLLYSKRSLSIDDLRHAVAVNPETYAPDPEALVEEETFLAIFCGLVTFEPETRLARLVHFTAKDFLVPYMLETERNPHALLASTCIARISDKGFRDIDDEDDFQAMDKYFFKYWPVHAEAADPLPEPVKQFVCQYEPFPILHSIEEYFENFVPCPHLLVENNSLKLLRLWISTNPDKYADDSVPKTLVINSKLRDSGLTPLAIALQENNIEAGKILLQVGSIDVDMQDEEGVTLLMHAVQEGNVQFARMLVDAGCNVNVADFRGITALLHAWQLEESDILNLFELDKMDVNASNKNGETALICMSQWGFGKVVRALVDLKDIQVNLADRTGRTALMVASIEGVTEIVRMLVLRQDIDVNAVDMEGRTALAEASRNGRTEIVKILVVVEGVVIDGEDFAGVSPLAYAARGGHVGVVQVLLSSPPGRGTDEYSRRASLALIEASRYGSLGVVSLLLEVEGVNINHVDQEGQTALMRAAGYGSLAVVKKLMAAEGIDVNAVDMNGRTALIHACSCMPADGSFDVILGILEGAKDTIKVNVADKLGRTALMEASLRGYGDIVKMLCNDNSLGVDVAAVDAEGQTALSLAFHSPFSSVPCSDGYKLLDSVSVDQGPTIHLHRPQEEYFDIFHTLVASRIREINLLQASLKDLNEGVPLTISLK
ncbi:ankyrin [Coprinopsis marcescibilis]|nr:ankyrin [Coprinopsis marcescibilis]